VHDYVVGYVARIAIIAVVFFIGCILIGMRLYIGTRRADQMDALIAQQARDKKLTREIIEAFAKVVDLKDSYTQGHSFRVAHYTEMLAREMGLDEETVEKYHNIALMHDIGKVGIPDSVLNKPGKLTDEEFALIKSHTTRGYDVLHTISLMPEIAIGARSHHERPDGRGYPLGLKGDELPLVAKIISVADCFDAMYSNRPYRSRMSFDRVVSIIKEISGTQLSAPVVEAFLRLVDKGELRAPDDDGGGSTESIENIRNEKNDDKNEEKTDNNNDK
ncbi:MAG: HD-GYP domain-containing protein, partial [Clostridia bacterium]|nr:HD-GYP domain-containing protein [Clostridia bacterium]